MKKRLIRIFQPPWYIVTCAAYPVLALLSYNILEVRWTAGARPLLVAIGVAVIFTVLLRLLLGSWHKAAFGAALQVLLFYSFGHLYTQVSKNWELAHLVSWMMALWLVLSVLALAWVGIGKTRFSKAAPGLNLLSLLLVLIAVGQVAWWSLPRGGAGPVDDHAPLQALSVTGQPLPDIYYIIPDSYGREDLLRETFNYDDSYFTRALKEMGFYVAACSQSNYNRTDISLASSLNMEYLQNLDEEYSPGKTGLGTLRASITRSTLRVELERAGYMTVAFATGFSWSEITDADVYLAPSGASSGINGFETLLLRTTLVRSLDELGWINLDQLDGELYRQRTQFILDNMDDLARMPGPKFVFIHIISPHPPFVYEPNGSPTDPSLFFGSDHNYTADTYRQGYTNQAAYISRQLITALDTLLSESASAPVILLQGDHAPWLQEGAGKFKILNAYYFPGHADLLYPSISPVNSFRLVLNTYLGADYPLLEDTSYYSPIPNIYDFQEYPNSCNLQ